MLVHQYEIFKMLKHENIDEMTARFMHIINQLKALGKRYTNGKIVRKILRSLSKAWHPKVTAIQEAKDLNVLSLDALIGSLKTNEIELNEVAKETVKKGKSIALKSVQKKAQSSKVLKASKDTKEENQDSSDDDDDDDDDSDEITHLAKKSLERGSKGRRRTLFPRKTKRARLSKMR